MRSCFGASWRVFATASAAFLAVVVAGCGSSSPAAAPASPGGAGSSASSAASPAGSASGTPVPATTAPAPSSPAAGVVACPTRYLSARVSLSQGATGSLFYLLKFTNIAHGVTCTLYGYPGVALAGGHPVTQIGAAATENPATPREVVRLAPGAAANAELRIVQAGNYPKSACHPMAATYLQVYPPNQTTPVYVGIHSTGCTKPVRILTVSAVRPGSVPTG
jgi:Protein of unknown function (DUF4232)